MNAGYRMTGLLIAACRTKIFWLERDLFILINAVYQIVLDITRRSATLTRWDQDKNSGEMRD